MAWAVRRIEADFQRSADTHLLPLHLPGYCGVALYLKDESSHPTGSLKHRLARSLFLHALCNGWLRPGACVVEASSGSTAVSEAYFARLLALPFVAVMPAGTSAAKAAAIRAQGGECHFVADPTAIYAEASEVARRRGGHFMDQFTYAERATDWRSNNNIAESIFEQMRLEPAPVPRWIVAGAGTGGTLATLGRFVRYRGHDTRICAVDAERSVLFDHFVSRDPGLCLAQGSRIEGIGRPRVEPSFVPSAIDAMVQVPDVLSIAAMRVLSRRLARRVGASSGSNLVAALLCAAGLWRRGEAGSVVTLVCDDGSRYGDTVFDDAWLERQGLACAEDMARVEASLEDPQAVPSLRQRLRLAGDPDIGS